MGEEIKDRLAISAWLLILVLVAVFLKQFQPVDTLEPDSFTSITGAAILPVESTEPESNETPSTQPKEAPVKEEKIPPKSPENEGITLNQLEDDIRAIAGIDYPFRKEEINNSKATYYLANSIKSFIIEKVKEKRNYINSYKDFYNYTYDNGYEFYGDNDSILYSLTTNLDNSSFDNEGLYRNFTIYRQEYIFSYSTKEHTLEKGKVIEFYDSLDIYNGNGYFQEGNINYMLKVYCAPDLIVKIRPREIKKYLMIQANQKRGSVDKNTENMIADFRKELFPDAEAVLEKCSVGPSFFRDFSVRERKYSFTYYYYSKLPKKLVKSDAPKLIRDISIFSDYLKKRSDMDLSQDKTVNQQHP